MIFLEAFPATIPFSSIVFNILFWAAVIAIYRNRNKSEHNKKMWRGIQMFFAVLLVTLGANYAKKSIKDWWSK